MWALWQVEVKAPGTPTKTTFLPSKSSCGRHLLDAAVVLLDAERPVRQAVANLDHDLPPREPPPRARRDSVGIGRVRPASRGPSVCSIARPPETMVTRSARPGDRRLCAEAVEGDPVERLLPPSSETSFGHVRRTSRPDLRRRPRLPSASGTSALISKTGCLSVPPCAGHALDRKRAGLRSTGQRGARGGASAVWRRPDRPRLAGSSAAISKCSGMQTSAQTPMSSVSRQIRPADGIARSARSAAGGRGPHRRW